MSDGALRGSIFTTGTFVSGLTAVDSVSGRYTGGSIVFSAATTGSDRGLPRLVSREYVFRLGVLVAGSGTGEDPTGFKKKSIPCFLRSRNSSKVRKGTCSRICHFADVVAMVSLGVKDKPRDHWCSSLSFASLRAAKTSGCSAMYRSVSAAQ